jgi:flagellar biogenesis protein FliO
LPDRVSGKRAGAAFRRPSIVESEGHKTKGDRMYIGGGFIALILIILLLIWLF